MSFLNIQIKIYKLKYVKVKYFKYLHNIEYFHYILIYVNVLLGYLVFSNSSNLSNSTSR